MEASSTPSFVTAVLATAGMSVTIHVQKPRLEITDSDRQAGVKCGPADRRTGEGVNCGPSLRIRSAFYPRAYQAWMWILNLKSHSSVY